MKIKCPSCGADSDVDAPGTEVVCWSCFHAWMLEEGAEAQDSEDATSMIESVDAPDPDAMPTSLGLEPDSAPFTEGVEEATAEIDAAPDVEEPSAAEEEFFTAPAADPEPEEPGFEDMGTEDTGELPPEAQEDAAEPEPAEELEPIAAAPEDAEPPAEGAEDQDGNDTSFVFRRRRHRSLSQSDVAVIGTYQRRSTEIPQADDIVWKPGSGPPPRAAAEQPAAAADAAAPSGEAGEAYNPFGDTEVVWGEEPDTVVGGAGTSGWGTETGVDGGGSQAGADSDPFASAGAPFGDAAATSADDPFGDIDTGGGFGDDPFASNPFAAEDDAAGGDANPFSTADFAQGGDGFDDFGFAALDDDGDGGGEAFGAPGGAAGGADDHFDVDVGDGATLVGGADAAGKGRRRRRRGGKKRGKAKGAGNKAAILGFTALFCVGLVMGQTDMGYFGMNLFLDGPGDPGAAAVPGGDQTGAGPAAATGATSNRKRPPSAHQGDAPADFARSIDGLKQKLAARPTDRASQQQLVGVLLRCKERHPEFFASKKYAEDLKKYGTTDLLSSDLQLKAQNLLADGKRDEAQAALMQYISTEQDNPEILYLLARITLQNKDEETAIGYYKATISTDAKHQAALYDLGTIYLKRQELGPARTYLEALLEANPSHSGAKLAMAQITLYEKGYEEAKSLIDQALSSAKNTQNDDEQFRAFWLKAMLADAQQNIEEKGYALSRALELRPNDERTALELGGLLGQQGKHQESLLKLQQCQKAGGASARFYEALVKAYAATNDPDSAKSQLNEALRKHPKETGLLMLQAESERMAEHYKTAKSIYATIIENDPSYNRAYLALAMLQFQEGRQQEAVETLTQGASVVEEKLHILEKKAEYQMKIGATLRAKETMGQILAIDPNNTDVKLRFATLLKNLGYADEAARYYRDLQIAGALNAETLLDYSSVLIRLKRYDDAFKHVETVISTDPLSLRANVLRGAVHSAKGEYKVADEDLRKALKVNSQSADAYFHLGRNEMAQGRVTAAVEYLAKASSLSAGNNEMRADLARAYTEVGGIDNRRKALAQYSQIITDYERYTSNLDRKRIDPDIYFRRGRLYYDNGQHREALTDFKEAMILDPVREDAVIEFARTLNTMGKRTEAEAYLKEILSRDPKNPSAHYEMGEIALKSNRRTQAEDHFKQAIAAGGANFPTAHRYLGFLYKEKGLTTLSCNSFKEYLRVAPKGAYDREEIARQTSRMCR